MERVVQAAGTAVVGTMATGDWQSSRDTVVALWRRVQPDQAEAVATELEELRSQVLTAREAGDSPTEEALGGVWRLRFQQLLQAHPELVHELRRLLNIDLIPVLQEAKERRRIRRLMQEPATSGHESIVVVQGDTGSVAVQVSGGMAYTVHDEPIHGVPPGPPFGEDDE